MGIAIVLGVPAILILGYIGLLITDVTEALREKRPVREDTNFAMGLILTFIGWFMTAILGVAAITVWWASIGSLAAMALCGMGIYLTVHRNDA